MNVTSIFSIVYSFLRIISLCRVINDHGSVSASSLHALLQVSSLFRPSPSFSGVAEPSIGEGEPGGGFRGSTTGFLSRLSPAFYSSMVGGVRESGRGSVGWCTGERESGEERGEGVRKVSLKLLQSLGSARSLSRSR